MFKLPVDVRKAYTEAKGDFESRQAVFANLDNTNLIASAKYWMQHCDFPKKIDPDSPVYDSTMWHIILPELIRRLENEK